MKQLIGEVSYEECKDIQRLFERKNGLAELIKIIDDKDDIYEKLIMDMGKTSTCFDNWWKQMEEKYQWKYTEKGRWEIDFNTCQIYLTSNEGNE